MSTEERVFTVLSHPLYPSIVLLYVFVWCMHMFVYCVHVCMWVNMDVCACEGQRSACCVFLSITLYYFLGEGLRLLPFPQA